MTEVLDVHGVVFEGKSGLSTQERSALPGG